MSRTRWAAAAFVLLLTLAGCASDPSEAPALTWQEAKASAQAMELEIADSLPQGKVAGVAQMPTGVLFDCGGSLVNWKGGATVTVSAGTEPEPLVRDIEAKYRESRFTIKTRDPTPAGDYEVQLRSPDTAEIYIIGAGWDPNTILITSSSECFPWPEGEYKGGEF